MNWEYHMTLVTPERYGKRKYKWKDGMEAVSFVPGPSDDKVGQTFWLLLKRKLPS